jgi:hypothetical protein
VDTLTSAEQAIAARRLAAVRPVVAALAGIAAPEAFAELRYSSTVWESGMRAMRRASC